MKAIKFTISLFFIILLVGCGRVQPIMNVEDTPITYDLQNEQVKSAIILAVTNRGWVVKEAGEGELQATLVARDHSAEIRIPFSNKYYSILYSSSVNLKASDGNIHRNYNRWINNLNVDIQKQLALKALN